LVFVAVAQHLDSATGSGEKVSTTDNPGTGPPIEDGLPVGPTLGAVLSKFCYVVLVGYVLGIGWKLFQIYRGNYTPEEPVYLKYK